MSEKPFLLQFPPGVQRDGTPFDAAAYLDASWCRFRLARPRKMGGYQLITDNIGGVPRRIHCFYSGAQIITHIGTPSGIQQVVFDTSGNFISIADRTPAGFVGGADIACSFDATFDTTSNVVQLVCHVQVDGLNLASALATTPFLGDIMSTTPLAAFRAPADPLGGAWTQPNVTGGVFCAQPYLFAYSSNGWVFWDSPNLPSFLGVTGGTSGAGQARISAQKVVAGMALRGGGAQSPAALFWTLSELIAAVFVGTSAGTWAFTTISPSSSILSAAGIVEYDGLYFWVGTDRFLVFNGVVNELPNTFNQDFFFNNLTPGFESRVFAFKVPRYGEIWWCAPMFGSTECNYAVIFNLRENCWYDTPLPDGGRSAGYFAQGFRYPIMTDVQNGSSGYGLWMHEAGTDKVAGATTTAVPSHFVTPVFGSTKDQQITDAGLSFQRLEADLIQSGDLTVQLLGQANARAPVVAGPANLLRAVPAISQEEITNLLPRTANRQLRLRFDSNALGGNYIFGRSIGHGATSDARLTS